MKTSDPIPVDQATSVDRPGTYNRRFGFYEPGGTWTWADPIQAGQSDSAKWSLWPDMDPEWGPFGLRVSQDVIARLYACGYALVKVLPEDGE